MNVPAKIASVVSWVWSRGPGTVRRATSRPIPGGDRLLIMWKGRSGDMCLRTFVREAVWAERCQPGNVDSQWVLAPWDWS
jgi:hypothetical protein